MSYPAPDTPGIQTGGGQNVRQRMLARKAFLWKERTDWESHWADVAKYQQPFAGRFQTSDTNRGQKRHQAILDNTPVFASRTLAAGMMSGMTSPARPWFRLALNDEDLMENGQVRTWLHKVTQILLAIFASSNTYRSLHQCYQELGLFGTWASFLSPDFDNVIHHYPLTVGEYALAVNHKNEVDTLYREMRMTVSQVVEQFGRDNCSESIKNLWDRGAYDQWVDVIHSVEPRRDRDESKRDAVNMPFKSCYFEPSRDNHDKLLSESGYRRFPVLAPRWQTKGGDAYGHSPGMECQGDARQLQHEQHRKGQGIDYQTNPPIQVPTQYKDATKQRLPGGVMYVDASQQGGGVRTAFEVQLNLQHLQEDIHDVRERIRTAYYADLFLMLANDQRSGITATEVAERHEEKLLMLGPVLERLHNELLSPLIDSTFDYAMEAGILPEPPQAIEGMEMKVEFVSVLAQAQRAIAVNGMDRLFGAVGNMAQFNPDTLDKINFDQAVDDYAEMYGVNPEIIVADDNVQAIRQQRAEMQQQQAAAEQAPAMAQSAKAAKDASQIDTQNMRDVMEMFSGYAGPTGGPGPGTPGAGT